MLQASPLRILLAALGLLGAAEAFTPARGAAAALALDRARGFEVALTLHAVPKREDHLASTDDPIEECIAVLANGEEPDEDMLAKCREIAVEEFANQATLEDENSY